MIKDIYNNMWEGFYTVFNSGQCELSPVTQVFSYPILIVKSMLVFLNAASRV